MATAESAMRCRDKSATRGWKELTDGFGGGPLTLLAWWRGGVGQMNGARRWCQEMDGVGAASRLREQLNASRTTKSQLQTAARSLSRAKCLLPRAFGALSAGPSFACAKLQSGAFQARFYARLLTCQAPRTKKNNIQLQRCSVPD